MRDEIGLQVKPFKSVDYIAPGTRSDEDEDENQGRNS